MKTDGQQLVELVSDLTTDFLPHPAHQKYRVPARLTPLDPLCDFVGADPGLTPQSAGRTLFVMRWDSGPGFTSFWHLHALRLPSGNRAYWVDDLDGRRVIAVGPGGAGADGRFCRALFSSNGKDFHAPILDSAPSAIWTSLRGKILIALFLDAIPLAHNSYDAVEAFCPGAIRKWLKRVLVKGGRELRGKDYLPMNKARQEFLNTLHALAEDFPAHGENAGIRRTPSLTFLRPIAKHLGQTITPLLRPLSRNLLTCWWSFSPLNNCTLELNAIDLPDGARAFWVKDDNWEFGEQEILVGVARADVTDEEFLRTFFATNGEAFDYTFFGSPPSEINTVLDPELLVGLVLDAYRAGGAWSQLVDNLPDEAEAFDERDPDQAREIVARHLQHVIQA